MMEFLDYLAFPVLVVVALVAFVCAAAGSPEAADRERDTRE